MADASQQVKEWGRHPVSPQRDVGAALAALSEEDLVRLRAIARLRARSLPGDMSWSDLLHEAVLRALTLAGLTTRNGPVRQPRRSPLFNGCSPTTRQP